MAYEYIVKHEYCTLYTCTVRIPVYTRTVLERTCTQYCIYRTCTAYCTECLAVRVRRTGTIFVQYVRTYRYSSTVHVEYITLLLYLYGTCTLQCRVQVPYWVPVLSTVSNTGNRYCRIIGYSQYSIQYYCIQELQVRTQVQVLEYVLYLYCTHRTQCKWPYRTRTRTRRRRTSTSKAYEYWYLYTILYSTTDSAWIET